MDYKKIVTDYNELLNKAHGLATRWVQAQQNGYSSAQVLSIDVQGGRVNFNAHPSVSGMGTRASFPVSLLEDDSNLEVLAKEQIKIYNEKRAALFDEEKRLMARMPLVNLQEIRNRIQSQTWDNPEGFAYPVNQYMNTPFITSYGIPNFPVSDAVSFPLQCITT